MVQVAALPCATRLVIECIPIATVAVGASEMSLESGTAEATRAARAEASVGAAPILAEP